MSEQIELTPENLLRAYCVGIFPMADDEGVIDWFSPDPRCVFEFERFHVPRSLRQEIRKGTYEIRINTAFERVMRECGQREEGTWISEEIIAVYAALHRSGFAHSVESWARDDDAGEAVLCGGLYGVAIGGAFFGESMFHRRTNASKVALAALIDRLKERGFTLLDTQWTTPHLEMFGAVEIPRDEYLRRLKAAIRLPRRFVEG